MSDELPTDQSPAAVEPRPAALPRKIVVLGGGMGSLSAVFQLTRETAWKSRYEITVYQIGWRLGGKGASGRSTAPAYHHRIEEHGVHVFFGFYTNAFRLMEDCYKELGRSADSLFPTWQDAFKGSNNIVLAEQMPDKTWLPWDFHPPSMPGQPTDDRSQPHLGHCVENITQWATQELLELFDFAKERSMLDLADAPILLAKLNVHAAVIAPLAAASWEGGRRISSLLTQKLALTGLARAEEDSSELDNDIELLLGSSVGALRLALELYWRIFGTAVLEADSEVAQRTRRTWILCNFIYANLNGIHSARLVDKGVESINDLDYRDWLLSQGIDDEGVMGDSSLVRWLYDALFAYRGGAIDKPSLEAGTAVLTAVKLLFTYNGEFLYKMQAGMGDVVFAPLYEVLRKRGVNFEFFHRVVSLDVENESGRKVVSRIHLERQAKVTADGYSALSTITDREGRRLDCWPAEPDFAQLQNGEALRQALATSGRSLETFVESPHGERLSLGLNQFDHVIFGIGLGSVAEICANLVSSEGRWKDMVSNVGTVATLGAQLWLDRDLRSLIPDPANPLARPAIFAGFDYDQEPINSYADMTQVLRRESWPLDGRAPQTIAYFCSVLRDERDPEQSADAVRDLMRTMLGGPLRGLWPGAWTAAGSFDWGCLVDQRPAPSTGEGRLDAQYFVGIANSSDRYVSSFVGSSRYRMFSNATGFANMVLSGDWVQNTFNVGCIESSIMSGLQAANAIAGFPLGQGIVGWGLLSKGHRATP